jgi:hypothetical protein
MIVSASVRLKELRWERYYRRGGVSTAETYAPDLRSLSSLSNALL